MTDQEINAAIAGACGQKVCSHQPKVWERRGPEGDSELYCPLCNEYLHNMRVPNYCTKLNAMHEAWQIDPPPPFTDSFNFRCELAWQLRLVVQRDYDASPFWKDRPYPLFKDQLSTAQEYWIANATARQRAEAFLRTIGKWKEEITA